MEGQGWTAAGELQRGARLRTQDGGVVEVESVAQRRGEFAVYNLEVASIHSYYVSPLRILVHNQSGGTGGGGGGGFAPGGKAPDQVMPGVRNVRGVYDPPTRRAPEPYSAHYDEYGRQIGRTDYTNQPDPAVHTNPHHHIRDYGPGFGPKGLERGPFPGPHPLDPP